MSDRIAVFNRGRVEQVGSPAELYEHPATPFVAGFVGVSNLIQGPQAVSLTGSPDAFAVRPEKIRLLSGDAPAPDGLVAVDGQVREVVYLGMVTRYLVDVEGGLELTVIEQNRDTTSMDVLAARGRKVRLAWDRRHHRRVTGGPA